MGHIYRTGSYAGKCRLTELSVKCYFSYYLVTFVPNLRRFDVISRTMSIYVGPDPIVRQNVT